MSTLFDTECELCFRAETTKLLALNVAQIQSGMLDGENSIEQIGDSFQGLANFCLTMQSDSSVDDKTKSKAAAMYNKVNDAIVAFQFYDRLAQRLEHVQENLVLLSEILNDNTKINNADDWSLLRTQIKSRYSIKSEIAMYEAVMNGASIDDAIEIFKSDLQVASNDDAIELF